MTPEERREAQLTALPDAFSVLESESALDSLLTYLDENEPEVADAIRYGLKEVPRTGVESDEYSDCIVVQSFTTAQRPKGSKPVFVIDYPDGIAKP